MTNLLTVYHGSTHVIETPVFGIGNPQNDYGLGFYCTETLELAKEWASSAEADGFANQYSLNTDGLSVLSLTGGDYHILNWLFILLENRKFRISGDVAYQAKQYIFEHFSVNYKDFDIIKGYRADDSYFSFANAFLNNTLSLPQLEKAMVLGKLGEQIVAVSPKAFKALQFQGSVPVSSEIYYPLRMARDTDARNQFKKERERGLVLSEKYILDIMREGWQNDDARLQRIILR